MWRQSSSTLKSCVSPDSNFQKSRYNDWKIFFCFMIDYANLFFKTADDVIYVCFAKELQILLIRNFQTSYKVDLETIHIKHQRLPLQLQITFQRQPKESVLRQGNTSAKWFCCRGRWKFFVVRNCRSATFSIDSMQNALGAGFFHDLLQFWLLQHQRSLVWDLRM